ncbi:nonstructural protein [Dipodfec virus UA23Rod_1217]|uniref:Nonstructural protein n=1 Tax=Dipodfec virus UA23Rod_1217 TaxID=2929329 RepID=A0A976N1X5_9VIRU|nr:nonstructural protein [Dipodfec virus UA23Rod_1217]
MKLSMYSVKDHLTGFMSPVLEQNDAVAMRNFAMACDISRSDKSLMSWKPSDYSLYRIADFDSDTGALTPLIPPVLVCNGDSIGGSHG